MSYIIRFYNCNSDSKSLNKNLTNIIAQYEINLLKGDKNLNDLDIELNTAINTSINFNYAYISGLSKYYFVKILPTSKMNRVNTVRLTLDPLMSYRNEILGLSVITERNTNNYNVYLPDSEQKITSQYKQFYHTFKGGDISYFKPHSSILCTLVGSE